MGGPGTTCAAANTLVITLSAPPVDTNNATGDNIFQIGAGINVTDTNGNTDVVGNTWDLATSTDVLIDIEAGPELD